MKVFTDEDYLFRLCTKEEIGLPFVSKEQRAQLEEEAQRAKPYASKLHELGEAALDVVLTHPGGPAKWFQENPAAHTKLLVKLATPIEQATQGTINVNISWLDPQRLSYKQATPTPEAIEDVSPKGWKEPTPIENVLQARALEP